MIFELQIIKKPRKKTLFSEQSKTTTDIKATINKEDVKQIMKKQEETSIQRIEKRSGCKLILTIVKFTSVNILFYLKILIERGKFFYFITMSIGECHLSGQLKPRTKNISILSSINHFAKEMFRQNFPCSDYQLYVQPSRISIACTLTYDDSRKNLIEIRYCKSRPSYEFIFWPFSSKSRTKLILTHNCSELP